MFDLCGDDVRVIVFGLLFVVGWGRRGTRKTPVVGIIERGNRVRVVVVANVQRDRVLPLMKETVDEGVEIHTDEFNIYNTLYQHSYDHKSVKRGEGEYVRYEKEGEPVHTNSIEDFWAHVKGWVKGIYHGVGPVYLQRYLNKYTFCYNNRDDEPQMFFKFRSKIAQGGRHDAMLTLNSGFVHLSSVFAFFWMFPEALGAYQTWGRAFCPFLGFCHIPIAKTCGNIKIALFGLVGHIFSGKERYGNIAHMFIFVSFAPNMEHTMPVVPFASLL